MKFDLPSVLRMALDTVKSPREAAETLLSMGIPRAALGPAVLLVVVLSIILALINTILSPLPPEAMAITPITLGMLQFAILMLTTFSIFWVGRMFGGTGRFDEALLLVIWLQFIMVCLQVVQTLLILVATTIAALVGVVGMALFFFLLTHFIAVLHGFRSLGKVFAMILAIAFGLVVGSSIILAMLGVTIPGAI